ncbi:glycosyltransferase family 4 protein [Homoserinibacter sp. YIM 151385]|uniref:glycosyltransferase family 4 protein n=1 Tax=Homoserinibacter sp. YIM 151385 TaxID=2985506 RepID=UPI003FA58984
MVFYGLVALIAAGVTFSLALLIWRLSVRFRLYPKIRERDVHSRPTPRLGGVAMFFGVIAAFAVASQLPSFSIVFSEPGKILGLLGAALLIVLIGAADDIWDLDWLTKLAGQLIAAGLMAWQGIQIISVPLPGVRALPSPIISLLLTVVIVVLVMNAVNFIDGLDGLVAGVAIIANGVFFIYSYTISYGQTEQSDYFNLAQLITAILIGACLGFLPLNWHRAKLFMGDAGALLTGLLMAASTVAVTGQIDPDRVAQAELLLPAFIPILLPFAVLVVPLLDFSLAVIRRLSAGKSPFSADRKHLHHRLLDMGHSHFHAVLIFYAWTAAASVGCLLFLFTDWWWAVTVTSAGLVVCTIVTLSPLSRRKAVEAAVQAAGSERTDASLARFDPLDAAAAEEPEDAAPSEAEADAVLERIATGPITTGAISRRSTEEDAE